MEEVDRQYNGFSQEYSKNQEVQDAVGDRRFYEILGTIELKDKKILDIGCGNGNDLARFRKLGVAEACGIDPSEEFVKAAQLKNPDSKIIIGKGERLPFDNESFDVVVSKYAAQTSPDVPQVLKEVARILRAGGYFILLSKHPLRQFLEKIKTLGGEGVDYFRQDVIDSFIFERKIHLREPSHPITEYLSAEVLGNFDLQDFIEDADFPASEQIDGHRYPTFFVAKYRRRKAN